MYMFNNVAIAVCTVIYTLSLKIIQSLYDLQNLYDTHNYTLTILSDYFVTPVRQSTSLNKMSEASAGIIQSLYVKLAIGIMDGNDLICKCLPKRERELILCQSFTL